MWPEGHEIMKHEKVKVDKVPSIWVYKKGEYYLYESYYMKGLLTHFISRIVNPLYHLTDVEEADRFI
jgi:hypothetical protein